jgi:hypothetical protein
METSAWKSLQHRDWHRFQALMLTMRDTVRVRENIRSTLLLGAPWWLGPVLEVPGPLSSMASSALFKREDLDKPVLECLIAESEHVQARAERMASPDWLLDVWASLARQYLQQKEKEKPITAIC